MIIVLSPAPSMPPFTVKPTLKGRHVTLRPIQDEDLPAMEEAIADPEVVQFTAGADAGAAPVLTHDYLHRWYTSRNLQVDRLDLAIVDNGTTSCVGEVVLNEWSPDDNSCNYRILIGPRGRGRRLGSEATQLVLRYAFTALGLHRLSLEVLAFNVRARRVYQKAGFRARGARRADIVPMAVLASEWAAQRAPRSRCW